MPEVCCLSEQCIGLSEVANLPEVSGFEECAEECAELPLVIGLLEVANLSEAAGLLDQYQNEIIEEQ
jgi:hypothetical protein